MVDYYALTGFHSDDVPDRTLAAQASATARATREVRTAVRIARDVTGARNGDRPSTDRGRVIPIAIKPAAKPYSTI